jgi:hypothetical protein
MSPWSEKKTTCVLWIDVVIPVLDHGVVAGQFTAGALVRFAAFGHVAAHFQPGRVVARHVFGRGNVGVVRGLHGEGGEEGLFGWLGDVL